MKSIILFNISRNKILIILFRSLNISKKTQFRVRLQKQLMLHNVQMGTGQFPPDNPPEKFPPRTIVPQTIIPPENCPLHKSHLGKLPPDNSLLGLLIPRTDDPWTSSTYSHQGNCLQMIMQRQNFYYLSFCLCHNKTLYKHKYTFFQNIWQIPLQENQRDC